MPCAECTGALGCPGLSAVFRGEEVQRFLYAWCGLKRYERRRYVCTITDCQSYIACCLDHNGICDDAFIDGTYKEVNAYDA